MNSFNSTDESVQNVCTIYNEEHNCTAIDNITGELCGEAGSLKIINELQKLYETRIKNVDEELENEFDQVCMKLEISKEWIRNLKEQNVMLVQIVEDLEQTACNRVKLLEQKLKQSSMVVSANMTQSNYTKRNINILSNRINDLEKDEEYMKQKIEFLQSDIRGLLELIRRAVQQNTWNLNGIQFLEIQPSDIPAPINCTCDQGEISYKKIQSMKLEIEHLQEREKKMIMYQTELENKLADLNEKLQTKEDTLKEYISQFKNFSGNLKKQAKFTDQIEDTSFIADDHQTVDMMLMADIVENLLNEKDLKARDLRQRLHDAESNLAVISRNSSIDIKNLKIQLNEKCKIIQETEQQMASFEKNSLEKQDILTTEMMKKNETIISLQKQVAMLQEQFRYANIQIQFKEGIIKEMRKELKETISKETRTTQNACISVKTYHQDVKMLNTPMNQQDQIISYLTKVKSLMEQEKEDLFKIKVELENAMEKFCCEKDEVYEFDVNRIKHKLTKAIEYVSKMCARKEESSAIIKSISCVDINKQFKLMDILRVCTIEAQIIMEDIKDEINMIVSTFKSRHQKYIDLNKEVLDVQNQLIRSKEKISETINKLQLQEEERTRHNERITSGRIKLKDIKNKMNHAQSRLMTCINEVQDNENVMSDYTEMCICNDLLYSVIEEIEQTSNHLQGCCVTSDLEELRNQFYKVDSSIKKLQEKTDEALFEHNAVEITLLEKEEKLRLLEKEVNITHLKIQNMLDTFISSNEQMADSNNMESQLCTQTLNEILETKQNLYKLRREHDELKHKMSQKTLYHECDEKTCLWKSRVTDLQDQVNILQQEAKCNIETNNFLRNNIQSMEEELQMVQAKSENFKRSHSIDNMELKKQIIKLENNLKLQKENECTLQQQLSESQVELKRSKDLLKCSHNEHNLDETLLHWGCSQFRHDTMTVIQLFKTLQSTMRSAKSGLQELKTELKKLICEDSCNFSSSARSIMNLMDQLQKYEDELDNYSQEIDKLKNILYSKDKLLGNMEKIIRIQKDSITMTQEELKELHQKLQEKIDNQDRVISQYEKEKKELIKENELQIQTIGHLQNALVETKKCMDQMGHKVMSDLKVKTETISLLTVYAEEAQSQYNECFSEEQLETHNNDVHTLKNKIDTLLQSKCDLENKCIHIRKLWQEAEEKIQELKKEVSKSEPRVKIVEDKECQCKVEVTDNDSVSKNVVDFNLVCSSKEKLKDFSYEHELQSEIDILIRENEDMKKQLQRYKLDFDIIDKELKIERENDTYTQQILFELQKLKDTGCCLQYENEQLKSELKKQTGKNEDLLEKLQFTKENDVKFGKLIKKLEDKQIQINNLYSQITNNESSMKKQTETIEELTKKLNIKSQQVEGYLSELNEMEEEILILHKQIQSLKNMLNEKSNDVVKLQADNKMLKNDNTILRLENSTFENKSKEDIYQLQMMLNDVQMQLQFTENNYQRVTEDYNKAQEQLIKMTKREADLQKCLTNMENDYCLKLSNIEKEKIELVDCLDKHKDKLEEIQKNYSSKTNEHCKLQDICKSYAEQLNILQQQVDKEKEKVKKVEESNCCIAQQLQQYKEQNCDLVKEKTIIEQNNCKIIAELQETHKCLLELKRECQLKNKSLACISAELTETAMSRSELCNQSQYVVSCIRVWMDEQREYVNKLNLTLKSQQQELLQLEFEKNTLLEETKKLRRINHLQTQKLKKIHRYGSKNGKNVCVECQTLPPTVDIRLPIYSKYSTSQKKLSLTKAARRISASGNAWWFPKMKYLISELRKSKLEYNENCCNPTNTDAGLEESRDCGYQSSTSK